MYAIVKNNRVVEAPVSLRSRYDGIGGFHLLTDAERLAHGWYPLTLVNEQYNHKTQNRSEVPNYEILEDSVIGTYTVTDKSIQTIMAETKVEYELEVEKLIQDEIDKYNSANLVAFKNIDACAKYTNVPTYAHYQFCVDVILWQTNVWESARTIQKEVLEGVRPMPTLEEFMAELPVFEA